MKGKCASSDTAPMVCAAPHSSFFDTFVFFYLQGLPSAVSKEENKKVPIIAGIQCNSFITQLIITQQGCGKSELFYLSKDKEMTIIYLSKGNFTCLKENFTCLKEQISLYLSVLK